MGSHRQNLALTIFFIVFKEEDIHVKCKWDESKKDEYKLNFDMSKINTSYLNLSEINATEITQEKIDNLSEDIKNILTEPAKITGMYKQFS